LRNEKNGLRNGRIIKKALLKLRKALSVEKEWKRSLKRLCAALHYFK
jgi:hypothetical protein